MGERFQQPALKLVLSCTLLQSSWEHGKCIGCYLDDSVQQLLHMPGKCKPAWNVLVSLYCITRLERP